MKINIKDNIPANIALIAVLTVVNAATSDGEGNLIFPKLSSVPVRGVTIMVKTESNRKTDCFKVWVKGK